MGIDQLGYIGIGSRKLAEWERVLTAVLGLSVSARSDDALLFRADSHLWRIAVENNDAEDLLYVGWQASSPQALEEIRSAVSAWGIPVDECSPEEAAARNVQGLIRFVDPDGLATEVFFGPIVCSGPFVPARPISGFLAEGLGLGHVVVATADAPRTERFYCEAMGFQLSDYGSGPLTFLRCNPRHHSIALRPAPPGSGKRLAHKMIEMRSLDDVGSSFDECLRNEVPVLTLLGKHVNDHAISFYLETPSGFEIECAYGGRLIDESTWELHRYGSREVWGHQTVTDFAARTQK